VALAVFPAPPTSIGGSDEQNPEHAWALLDELGWDADATPRPVAVDVDVYGEDLREALELLRPLLAMQEREAEAGDRW
jgi:hypothetical protein